MKGGWSTRDLAEIAGTTVKTVRHYHRVGLLEEPERAANGYKQYRIGHLVRLLRLRRLVDLGVPLSDIAAMEESAEGAEQVLRALDAELAASIERQQRMRDEVAGILRQRELAELPPGFGENAGALSDAERAFLLVCSRIFEPWVMETLQEMQTEPRSAVGREFDALTEEASEETRQRLAERYAPEVLRVQQDHPRLTTLKEQGAGVHGPRHWSAFLQGIVEMYNPAQIDVLQRVNVILGWTPASG
ncbi:MerR family transcriptional regulator [Micromonospora rosaria]|uniref:MerR family transcriptional regulator n=2 Tax=Micromonospora rosaria TaxID=47874 RepID=A0A136PZY8_9ACTN|nr:MerR family transcriptional regulator [Micromonospora rosaria]